MSEGNKIQLFKVVKELNIGLRTAVDFLKTKGYKLIASPNTLISQEMYKVLEIKFSKRKSSETDKISKVNLSIDRQLISEIEIAKKPNEPENNKDTVPTNSRIESRNPTTLKLKIVDKVDLSSFKSLDSRKEKISKIVPQGLQEIKPPATKFGTEEERKARQEVEIKGTPEVKKTVATEVHVIRAKADHLTGPKVVGKIDLPSKTVKTPPPIVSNTKATDKPQKRKRKRKDTGGEEESRLNPEHKTFSTSKASHKRIKKYTNSKTSETPPYNATRNNKPPFNSVQKLASRSKMRREKRESISQAREDQLKAAQLREKVLQLTEFVTANDLAKLMNVPVSEVVSACVQLGLLVSINQRLDAEIITLITDEFGYDVEFVAAELLQEVEIEEDPEEFMVPRSPIVTVMGHVDHGKTSLLDFIRKTNVIAGESGGITQHIAAHEVTIQNGKKVTFLDTPGHEAFTAMRARGAQVTDIAVIVIAADDAVMPQSIEAINHVQAANVPIVFAFNKIDKEGANVDKIREQLSNMNILVEEWGGKYQTQEISAKTGLNVDKLLEKILLEAELLNLRANPDRRSNGIVLEASLDKGRGIVTNLLVQGGTLKTGDPILAGQYHGKIKALFNERGRKISAAGPSQPVIALGMNNIPVSGDKFFVTSTEQEAREIANKRFQLQREQGLRTQKHVSLELLNKKLSDNQLKELKFILKADVDGSLEALSDSLQKLSTDSIQVVIIHKSIGQVTESDVLLAAASDAIVIGFGVKANAHAKVTAERERIDMRFYSIIYKAIEEVQLAIKGLIEPKIEIKVTAEAEVREIFRINKIGTIAGSQVTNGKLVRNNAVQVIRNGEIICRTTIKSLKRFKDDVKEVTNGQECGIILKDFDDILKKDLIQSYTEVKQG